MIRILIVDDQTLIRHGISNLLSMSDKVEVVGDSGDGDGALYLVNQLSIDIILMDVRMPGMSGLDVLRKLNAQGSTVPVLMLTTFEDKESLRQAIKLGAKGYLLKDVSLDNLISSIELVVGGQSVFDNRINAGDSQVKSKGSAHASFEEMYELTHRELTIVELVVAGASNKEIAAQLNLKMGTVKNYVSSILLKLNVRDRTQAVIKIKEEGWL
jgi:DNA-binding NarL/FixJ family response regulator